MGATSGFKVGIASPVAIDIGLVTSGSVNSWLAGNFNYDVSSAYPDVTKGTLSADDVTSLAKLSVSQDTAGFFNLPVCKVLDLRSFPNAAAGTGFANSTLSVFFHFLTLALLSTQSFLSLGTSMHSFIHLKLPLNAPPRNKQNILTHNARTHSSLRLRLNICSRRCLGRHQRQILQCRLPEDSAIYSPRGRKGPER